MDHTLVGKKWVQVPDDVHHQAPPEQLDIKQQIARRLPIPARSVSKLSGHEAGGLAWSLLGF